MFKKKQFLNLTSIIRGQRICLLAILSLLLTNLSFGQSVSQNTHQNDIIQDQIILKLKSNYKFNISTNKKSLGLQAIDQIAAKQGTYTIRQLGLSKPKTAKKNRPNFENIVVLKYDSDINLKQAIKDFEASGMVEYAEANGYGYGAGKFVPMEEVPLGLALTPNDGEWYARQYWSENDGTFDINPNYPSPPCVVDADIDLEAAWDVTTGSSNVRVAILDTGFKMDHPEMAGRLIAGRDFINDDDDPTDDNGHGTNVAGITGATGNNGIGHAGVDWNCEMLIVKVLDAGNSGAWTDIADGVTYAVDNGADVINMSIQCDGCTPPTVLSNAVEYAYDNNVVVVSIMGNYNSSSTSYPGIFSQTIAVGATDCDDTRVDATNTQWGSNYGNHIDLVSPGNWVYGLRNDSNDYGYWYGGTSMAAPMVAGVASLLLSINPDLTVEEIREILRNTADDQVGKPNEDASGFDIYYGAGRLNAEAALLSITDCDAAEVDTPCDDNNACTGNDVLDANCNCAGTYEDSDNDGVCDADDVCPPDACDDDEEECSAGSPCDDNDDCTAFDTYNADCECVGILADMTILTQMVTVLLMLVMMTKKNVPLAHHVMMVMIVRCTSTLILIATALEYT